MAGNFLSADMSVPDLNKYKSTDQKLSAIESYLFQLLESLRYTLRNLSMDNFNQTDLQGWVDKLEAGTVIAQTVVSQTVITNELYSDYGNIADLTVAIWPATPATWTISMPTMTESPSSRRRQTGAGRNSLW